MALRDLEYQLTNYAPSYEWRKKWGDDVRYLIELLAAAPSPPASATEEGLTCLCGAPFGLACIRRGHSPSPPSGETK